MPSPRPPQLELLHVTRRAFIRAAREWAECHFETQGPERSLELVQRLANYRRATDLAFPDGRPERWRDTREFRALVSAARIWAARWEADRTPAATDATRAHLRRAWTLLLKRVREHAVAENAALRQAKGPR